MYVLPPLTPEEMLLYSRKSRTDDPNMTVEEVLANHEKILNDWVERNLPGMGPIPQENRYHEVVSGETIESRPKMRELLKRIESPKIKAILCVEPQRLSRGDLEDIGRLVKLLRFSNTIVITSTFSYDLRDDHDRDSFERELKRGNEFLEYSKKIMRRGRELAVERGHYIGNKPPYGYDKIVVKEGNKKCHTLTPNPEQARVVRMIFEMYRDGLGSHRIAARLNEMRIPPAKGKRWHAESLNTMRKNEHYIGKVFWNHRKEVKTIEDGELVTSRPINNEYLSFPGKHEPIIDMELWNAVQEVRGKIPPVKRSKTIVNEFAGLIYCDCGRAMSLRVYKKKDGSERSPSRLLCNGQIECEMASCTVEEMREEVIKILQSAIADFELRIERSTSDSAALHKEIIKSLEKRLAELNAIEISQWEKYTTEGMPKHIFDMLNEKVLKERDEVVHALCVAKDSVPEPVDYENRLVMFSDALALLQDPDAPALQKNLLLKQCIERIVYKRKKKPAKYGHRWGEPEPMELEVHLTV